MHYFVILAVLLAILCHQTQADLPEGFDYLSNIDPTILQSVRYAQSINFVAEVIDGYLAKKIIMTKLAAISLSNVQQELKNYGYSLVVYDAYRPQKAVNHFLRWIQKPQDYTTKSLFYPWLDKNDWIPDYLSPKSGHTRGSTIDLSLIPLSQQLHPIQLRPSTLANGQTIMYLDDGSEFMCGHFDLVGEVSHHDSDLVSVQCSSKRDILRHVMQNHGFRPLQEEWWHYTLIMEPFPDTYFDFDIL